MRKNPIMLAIGTLLGASLLPLVSQANEPVPASSDQIIFHTHFPYESSDTDLDVFNLHKKDGNGHVINNDYAHTVLISNLIAGSMYVHLMHQKYPKLQYDRDYMIGTLLGQLLQESGLDDTRINKQFGANDDINNPTIKGAYLSAGQGGPYQINDYSKKLPYDTAPTGLGLINYDTVRKTLGYTIADQDSGDQTEKVGPDKLDEIYFAPMTVAFYHLNDVNRLNIESATSWYVNRDAWHDCWNVMTDPSIAKEPNERRLTDFVMNVIYNAGDYSPVLSSYLAICKSRDPSQLASMNDYNLGPEDYRAAIGTKDKGGDTYYRYPRQVSFYADQLYGKDLTSAGLNINNNIQLSLAQIKDVFIKSISLLSYKINPKKTDLANISAQIATAAFNKAVSDNKLNSNSSFNLSSESERNALFNFIDDALTQVENAIKVPFSSSTYGSKNADDGLSVHIYTSPNIPVQMNFVANDKRGDVLYNDYLTPGSQFELSSKAIITRMLPSGSSANCTADAIKAFNEITVSKNSIKQKQMTVDFQNDDQGGRCMISVEKYKPASTPTPVKPGDWDPQKYYAQCEGIVNYNGRKYQNKWAANVGVAPNEKLGDASDAPNQPWRFIESKQNTCPK
ncbi:hypothetical protein SOPP22_05955 [Shewanella sp. OPT22]|nr:hypothetical protein SOPP22_05955 [Shewanella sp. OPT22]